MGHPSPKNRGFSLLELLLVLVTVGILAMAGLSTLGNPKAASVRSLAPALSPAARWDCWWCWATARTRCSSRATRSRAPPSTPRSGSGAPCNDRGGVAARVPGCRCGLDRSSRPAIPCRRRRDRSSGFLGLAPTQSKSRVLAPTLRYRSQQACCERLPCPLPSGDER